jgi:plasmid stability protein
MPVTITVRNVDDDVRDELAARAARSGRSLQEYLSLELRRLATTPSAAEAVARARLNAQTYPALGLDEIVDAVDAGRR